MIPHAVQITLPTWVQVIIVVSAILTNVATAAFVLFVLWPSIRNSERRGRRIERWIDGPDGKRLGKALMAKIEGADGLSSAGKVVDKGSWGSQHPGEGQGGL